MANLNLSQFGENTSVSDADYTFVWDSANSISKKVTRNSWLTSPSLSTSAPVTISQTWNGTGSTVFTAFKVNATSTASADASRLLDLQIGGVSKLSVTKAGTINFGEVQANFDPYISRVALGTLAVSLYGFNQNHVSMGYAGGGSSFPGVTVSSGGHFAWSSSSTNSEATRDTILVRDSASGNTLALRNGAAAQTFRVYKTYPTTGVDFERFSIDTTQSAILLAYESGGTGFNRDVVLRAKQDLYYDGAIHHFRNTVAGGSQERLTITAAGNVGIGTTAPGANLHIRNDQFAFTGIYVDNRSVGANSYSGISLGTNNSGTNQWFLTRENHLTARLDIGLNLGSPFMSILAAGNVGIGTTSPTSKLHVAETWNNAGTAFCAIKSVITDTNSAAGSDFLELYSGTSTQPLRFDVQKTGQMNIYGAWTDTSNYERLSFSAPSAANAIIGTNKAGTGTARGLEFQTDGVSRWSISTTGHLLASTDNTYDIGASGASRPRNIYVGSQLAVGTFATFGSYIYAENYYFSTTKGLLAAPSDGVFTFSNRAATDFTRLQFGGTTNLFPAIKRNAAGLDIVLANDSGFAAVQDLYRRFGSGTPEGVVTAPIGAVYHCTDGGAGTSFYVKESGTGNTGWVGK